MDRPRRTLRQPVKSHQTVTSDPAPRVTKRKVYPEQGLNALLESSKSELTSMELPVRISLAFNVEVLSLGNVSSCDHTKLQVLTAQWASSLGHNQRECVANAFRRLSSSP